MKGDFDAVIVGGSVAGCAAARLYAQRGARVALVERRPDVDAYKTVCTHYIQPSATPTLQRLGLAGDLDARGAVRNSIDLWTPYGGWIRHRQDTPYGYNVRRQTLDPMLRRLTAETPGVELLTGWTATERARQRPAHRRGRRGPEPAAAGAAGAAGGRGRRPRLAHRQAHAHARPRAPAQPLLLLGLLARGAGRRRAARACGSWSPTARTRSPTRTT